MLRLLLPLFWPWTFFVFFFVLLKAKALCPRNRKLLQKTWKKIKYKKEKKLLCLNGPINGLLSLTTTGVLWYTIQRLSQRIKILQTTTWCFLLLFIGFIDRDIYSIPSSSSSWIQLLAAKSEPPRKRPSIFYQSWDRLHSNLLFLGKLTKRVLPIFISVCGCVWICMAGDEAKASTSRDLDQTATWAVSGVCAVIILVSLVLEKVLHKVGAVRKLF